MFPKGTKVITMKKLFFDNDLEEICPHCSYINKIKWNGISKRIKCSSCGEKILLCCLCNMDEVECNKCPYENE